MSDSKHKKGLRRIGAGIQSRRFVVSEECRLRANSAQVGRIA